MTFALPGAGDPVIVQGITGTYGRLHAELMREYGTNVAAGVTPGKGGQAVGSIPVYDTVREAGEGTGARAAVLFVPAPPLAVLLAAWAVEPAEAPVASLASLRALSAQARLQSPLCPLAGPGNPRRVTPAGRRCARTAWSTTRSTSKSA